MAEKGSLAKREEEILAFWDKEKVFEQSLAKPSPKGEFVFYDGPPFASGLPHYGHILAGTIKDAIPRFRTMQGYRVPRQWGWDCHGLPVENLVEKEKGFRGKRDIEEFGIENFNEAAREHIMKDDAEWKRIIPRTGRWADMDLNYKTMDTTYTESVWWAFATLHKRGLIYEGFKSLHYCPHCGTTLSNFEVAQGYKDIDDLAVTVKLKLVGEKDTSLLIWTTTPWTLPGNAAAAVNPDAEYWKVKVGEEYVIASADYFSRTTQETFAPPSQKFIGKDLVGKYYEPPFGYFKDEHDGNKKVWRVYAGDFVTLEDGTGVVHLAPAFGADDLALAQKEKIPLIHHVTDEGKFITTVADFAGLSVKPKGNPRETDEKVAAWLEEKNLLFKKDKITHSYPHCWRCDTPLLNWAADSWFVDVQTIKDKLVSENKQVVWVPTHVGEGRFGKWLEGARDWAISRNRYWGAPIPVWRCTKCGKNFVADSITELQKRTGGALPKNKKGEVDLHRPYIDEVTVSCACGEEMKRAEGVFDCWFESGSMPFASKHYPFEKSSFDPKGFLGFGAKGYPADFIAEGLDQTRGWFYSLLVLGVALFGKSPYQSVVVNGLVLAGDGQKMSKRLKNYPDPEEIIEKYGADSMRYYLLSSSVIRGEDLRFQEKGVDEISKKLVMRLDNVRSFYELYANHVGRGSESSNVLDRWILSRLAEVTNESTAGYESYELDVATRPLMGFVDDLSTWYVRRSRDRFKEEDDDKRQALATLRYVLFWSAHLLAPVMPFFADDLYRKIKEVSDPESVHLSSWPEVAPVDTKLIAEMKLVREVSSRALQLREKAGLKVRQPLAVLSAKNLPADAEMRALIAEEINVKEVLEDAALAEEVALDTALTPELKSEGMLRDALRLIQDLRKSSGLTIEARPTLEVRTNIEGQKFVEEWKHEMMQRAGLRDVQFGPKPDSEAKELSFPFEISLR